MQKNLFVLKKSITITRRWVECSLQVALSSACMLALLAPAQSQAAASAVPNECKALQAKYPQFKGKALVNAINPHTPGYETIDPKDPEKYIGFDIDLGETIGSCLGFTLS